jgi:tetratricopeptide (TPR) repeat protein
MLDDIPGLRNRVKGHSWTLSDEKYHEHVVGHLPTLAAWLGMLALYRNWTFFVIRSWGASMGAQTGDGWAVTGNLLRHEVKRARSEHSLTPGDVYLARNSCLDAGELEPSGLVHVSPLFLARRTAGLVHELFIYQGGDSRKVAFVGTISNERLEGVAEAAKVAEFLSEGQSGKRHLSPRAERTLAPIREASVAATAAFVRLAVERRIYLPNCHADRRAVQAHLEAFLDSGLPAALLVAPSGLGKTSLLARLGAEWMKENPPHISHLIIAADSLPIHGRDLPSHLASRLGRTSDLAALVESVGSILSRREQHCLLVTVDGIDRHGDPSSLITGITDVARIFAGSGGFRILGACTPAVLKSHTQQGGALDPRLFFTASFGIRTTGTEGQVGIDVPAFSEEELEEAYRAYQAHPDMAASSTPFENLTEDMVRALMNPLVLRLAMEVHAGQPLPAEVFGISMLQQHIATQVAVYPARLDLVAELVDLMIAHQRRSLTLEMIREDGWLRQAILDESPASPMRQLCESQVLLRRLIPAPAGLPFPPAWEIEFTFDRVLEYLVFWRLVHRKPDLLADPVRLAELAAVFPPARGALQLLCLHLVGRGDFDLIRCAFRLGVWDQGFWTALFRALVGEFSSPDKAARLEELFAALFGIDPAASMELVSGTARGLFVQGRWPSAWRLLMLTSAAPGVTDLERARELNRRVLLEKNMDRWTDAKDTSDQCLRLAGPETQKELVARILINRSSVVFDLGPRQEVPLILAQAAAAAADDWNLLAAVRNNAGLYRHYHDDLTGATDLLQSSLEMSEGNSLQQGYVHANLSLLLLSRSLTETGRIEKACEHAERALDIFRQEGHSQGISYATSNRGIVYMAAGAWNEAEECFQQTRRIARRLGEKWTHYGAMANSACLLLRRGGDLAKALGLVDESLRLANSNQDRKGIGDAGLLAGAIRLEILRRDRGEASSAAEAADRLAEAHRAFVALGQRLGQSMASWGLSELVKLTPGLAAIAGTHPPADLSGTAYEFLPARLVPLPWHMFLLMEVF